MDLPNQYCVVDRSMLFENLLSYLSILVVAVTVARDGFGYPEDILTHNRCLLHCEMCWDANWCPLSLYV